MDRFSQCLGSFGPVSTASAVVTEQASAAAGFVTAATASWPSQIFDASLLLLGLALLIFGYKMVRPLNFAAGAYFGGSVALLLLNIFAPTLTYCAAIVGAGVACGVLVGLLCAMKRGSVLAVLGLVAGEIVGDVVYKTLLLPLGAPEFAAFFSIGFFAVLVRAPHTLRDVSTARQVCARAG